VSVEFAIGEMTRFETAEDGSSVRLDMEDVNGRLVSLHMPLKCLNRLIMTLPEIVRRALQAQHRDASLRIVYPVSRFQLELAGDSETRILALETPDGFSASFGLTEEQCREIGADDHCEVRANCAQIN
jgi:hypothetical protein